MNVRGDRGPGLTTKRVALISSIVTLLIGGGGMFGVVKWIGARDQRQEILRGVRIENEIKKSEHVLKLMERIAELESSVSDGSAESGSGSAALIAELREELERFQALHKEVQDFRANVDSRVRDLDGRMKAVYRKVPGLMVQPGRRVHVPARNWRVDSGDGVGR